LKAIFTSSRSNKVHAELRLLYQSVYQSFVSTFVTREYHPKVLEREMTRASTFAARPTRSKPETAWHGPFMLNYNLFSGQDRPVARNIK